MNENDRQQRLAVCKTIHNFRRGGISRRRFLKRCAELGFGFSSISFLGSCMGEEKPPPTRKEVRDTLGPKSAGIHGTDQQNFLKEVGGRYSGTTLRVVSEDTPPSKATKEIMKEEFIPLTGINVEWELLPLDQVLAKISADTALKAGTHDIFYWDQAWIGRFVNDAVDPRELLEKKDLAYPDYNFEDILPPLVEHIASYKGRLAAIPYDIPIFIMMYRKDIFEELRLPVPETLEEYMTVIRAIHEAKAPKIYGTTAEWKSGHYALICDMVAWLWAHGGSIFGADEQPAINDERAFAAMTYMLELGKYMPPGVTTWDWHGEAKSFAQGLSGIYISHGEFFPSFDDPAKSRIVGLAEAAPCPREIALRTKDECGFDEKPGFSRQGGSSMAISKYSRNVDAAWVFLQWATSSDVTTRVCLMGGGASPIRKSNYEDPRVKAKAKVTIGTTRHFDITLDAIMNRMGTEPHLPHWANLAVDSFAVELGKMTTNQQSIKTTLDRMAEAAERAASEDKKYNRV